MAQGDLGLIYQMELKQLNGKDHDFCSCCTVYFYLARLNRKCWDFPGSPVVKTSPSNSWNVDLIPAHGVKIPGDSQPKI